MALGHYQLDVGHRYLQTMAADDPKTAEDRNQEFWQHCSHLEFYKKLGMSDS